MNAIIRSLRSRNRKNPDDPDLDEFLESDKHFIYQDACRPPNTHFESPIDLLPSEILEMIFVFTQADIAPWPKGYRKWIYCTHVSRRWRRVSLGFNHLWSSVDTSWCRIASTFIRRSGNAPLRLWINLKADTPSLERQTIDWALTQISRIRELYLQVEGVKELTKISSSLLQNGLQSSIDILDIHSSTSLDFPNDIFKQDRGTLRSLTITNVQFPYPPALLHSITRLRITWTQHRGRPLDFIDLRNTLDLCANLVELEFRNMSIWNTFGMDTDVPFRRTTCLPRLHRLSFYSPSSSEVIQLLNHLKLPTLNSMKIYGFAGPYSSILPVFTSQYDSCRVAMSPLRLHVVFSHLANPDLSMDVHLRLRRCELSEMLSNIFSFSTPSDLYSQQDSPTLNLFVSVSTSPQIFCLNSSHIRPKIGLHSYSCYRTCKN
ncbi:hypothetical protein BD410DRAFT_611652 [Rickenella mellea]|uniref:Uncharacterized protein n=1 Tax=Rickenella mellea TaxID=50990 RepID=A0A4Y7PQC2_9AGAM|nr:hypothetical protein BD410DRAFT_611652 [Rickenella mellea]